MVHQLQKVIRDSNDIKRVSSQKVSMVSIDDFNSKIIDKFNQTKKV